MCMHESSPPVRYLDILMCECVCVRMSEFLLLSKGLLLAVSISISGIIDALTLLDSLDIWYPLLPSCSDFDTMLA